MPQNFLDTPAGERESANEDSRERFERAVAELRPGLHAHCYRMLGSVHDADDALQDALLRGWAAFDRFEGRSSLRTWLYTVATRTCLDTAKARGKRALPIDLGPAATEPTVHAIPDTEIEWLTPYPDPADSVERAEHVRLAFVATLQLLSGNERAALLLVDVLGFSASDAASAMGTNSTAIHSALARGRRTLAKRYSSPVVPALPRPSQSSISLAHRFSEALTNSDLRAFIDLLAPNATWQMPPLTEWYAGSDAVAAFAHAVPMTLCPSWRTRELTANGQAAVAFYVGEDQAGPHEAWSLTLLDTQDGLIASITSFLDPGLFARFELPTSLN
ncbi:RNA polymerase sigma-70 factor (ECF subfamily) [Microbacterium sp. SORGH_AS428]|uniref:RNA polymerase subunit sigma-70 n=1 Tax=Microbacterium sp. SORGH_AS_0428 TaxID=3041788 RepID=UPI00285B2134|nr:RNA polymerase subunit sigma-70 [Microbacterium sp. SORGH_AS_0428]MDR6199851.1 RNA polymerase sigma-70 factor (ECF subfamily) [Microbacterium sp. SORGH_AS_0428]